jgi:FAD/FMN-containing dehydrogenase
MDVHERARARADDGNGTGGGRLSRRGFLSGAAGAGAVAALGWLPSYRVPAGAAAATLPTPPAFPPGIPLYQQAFENWAREIRIDAVWTCAPGNATDVVTIANWALANGYKVRPRGAMHNWSPLTIVPGSDLSRVLLVDTMQGLRSISVNASSSPATVTTGAGATMDAVLAALQGAGLGLTSVPAPGNLTVGGALAIDAHGAALPRDGETQVAGSTYGSLSNIVTSLTAVVWSSAQNQYVLKTFDRSDPDIKAFLTHLGRAFVTSVTLQAHANQRLRCQSWYNVPTAELFAPQGSGGRTFASYVANAGRVEAIWFPFTDNPWLKVWKPSPGKPLLSRQVTSPYNYSFSDQITPEIEQFLSQLVQGNTSGTPSFGGLQLSIVQTGLIFTGTWDIWGWSKDVQLYIRPSTLRVSEGGAAVLCRRSDIQRVVSEFATWFKARLAAYQAQGRFPINGPVEIRCSGLDRASDVKVASSGSPQLSALRPRPDRPEWDTAVWLDVLTIPGTPDAFAFYRDMEQWMLGNYTGAYATMRPEWSKGWAYTTTSGWADPTILGTTIPDAYRAGQPSGDNWDTARNVLNAYDPHRIYSNGFVDTLLP